MKIKHVKVRFGKILATIWFTKIKNSYLNADKPQRFIISFHGLPGHPFQFNPALLQDYIQKGFVIVYPDYIGTWASYGLCTLSNCLDTAIKTIRFIKGGSALEIWNQSKIKWMVEDITLLGGSFGGSVALVAGAKSDDVRNIISIAAPIDYKTHGKIEGENENIEKLYNKIKITQENLWRIRSKKDWNMLASGQIDLNPIDYVEQLKDKNVLLIHGNKDDVVSVKQSINIFNHLKGGKGRYKLIILRNEGHLGNDVIGRKELFKQVTNWLR